VTAFACGRFRPSTRQTTIKRAKRNDSRSRPRLRSFRAFREGRQLQICHCFDYPSVPVNYCLVSLARYVSLVFPFRPLRGEISPPPPRNAIDVCLKAIWGKGSEESHAQQHANRFNREPPLPSSRSCRFFDNAAIQAVIQRRDTSSNVNTNPSDVSLKRERSLR